MWEWFDFFSIIVGLVVACCFFGVLFCEEVLSKMVWEEIEVGFICLKVGGLGRFKVFMS